MADNNDEFKKYFEEGLKYLKEGDNLYNFKKFDEAKVAYTKAIEKYKKAIDINPKNDITLLNLGTAYSNFGNVFFNSKNLEEASKNYKDAIEKYNEAIVINPGNDLAFLSLGITYSNLGNLFLNLKNLEEASKNYKDAIDNLNKAIVINPKNDITLLNLGTAYSNFGNVFFNLKNLEEASKNYNLAIEKYNEAIDINPGNDLLFLSLGITYSNLGNTYLNLKDNDKKNEFFKNAIKKFCDAYTLNKEYSKNRDNKVLIINSLLKFIDNEHTIFNNFCEELRNIDNFFISLVCEYNDILVQVGNISEKVQKNYKDLLYNIYGLWKSLRFNEENKDIYIYQYTDEKTLNNTINNQKLRLRPADYQNDPKEGITLFDFLEKKAEVEPDKNVKEKANFIGFIKKIKKNKDKDTVAFIRCFTELEDNLVMWDSSYAKNGKGIAIGIKIEKLNKSISGGLHNKVASLSATPFQKILNEENQKSIKDVNNEKKDMPIENLGLYEVLYLSTDKLSAKITEDKNDLEQQYEELYKELKDLKEQNKSIESEKLDKFKLLGRLKILNNIFECLNEIKTEDLVNENLINLISSSLIPLKHLIKDESYSHEKEIRLVYVGNIKDNKDYICLNEDINTDLNNEQKIYAGIYIETEPILFKDEKDKEKIYLGPKIEESLVKKSKLEHFLAYNDRKAEVKLSEIKYR